MTSKQEDTQERLDAVLDAALDDLDDDDDDDDDDDELKPQPQQKQPEPEQQQQRQQSATSSSRPVQGPLPPPPTTPSVDAMDSIDEMMKHLMQHGGGGDPGDGGEEFLGRLLQEMQTQIGAELEQIEKEGKDAKASSPRAAAAKSSSSPKQSPQSATTSSTTTTTPSTSSTSTSGGGQKSDVDEAISSLIEGMANHAKLDTNDPNNMMGEQDEMLRNMMQQLGGGVAGGSGAGDDGGEGFNADALIDGMMEQLLAKDLMYEPMKKVAEKFPNWLKQNEGKIPPEEYDKRRQQYQCFQKLVHTYDTEPDNVQLLMLLMQDVQEFGQPPPEIIQDIAPGLELDADGLPKMDGAGGLPFPSGDEECRIM